MEATAGGAHVSIDALGHPDDQGVPEAKLPGLPGVLGLPLLELRQGVVVEQHAVGAHHHGQAQSVTVGHHLLQVAAHRLPAVQVPVGEGLLGRVVTPLGEPIDGQGPIEAQQVFLALQARRSKRMTHVVGARFRVAEARTFDVVERQDRSPGVDSDPLLDPLLGNDGPSEVFAPLRQVRVRLHHETLRPGRPPPLGIGSRHNINGMQRCVRALWCDPLRMTNTLRATLLVTCYFQTK